MVTLPASSHVFDASVHTTEAADYIISTVNRIRHLKKFMYFMIFTYWAIEGSQTSYLPLWRFNGSQNTPQDIPVILIPGFFATRFTVDYYLNGDLNSLAKWLANRGIDVWVAETESISSGSNFKYNQWLYSQLPSYAFATLRWLYSETEEEHDYYENILWGGSDFYSQGNRLGIMNEYTYTADSLAFEDLPALISKVCKVTGKSKVQLIGHSLGGIISYGLISSEYCRDGLAHAGEEMDTTPVNMPAEPILSLATIGAPGGLTTCPTWISDPADSGEIDQAWTYRPQLGRWFNYSSQVGPKTPMLCIGPIDTALLRHAEYAYRNIDLPFYYAYNQPTQYYNTLYAGGTVNLFFGSPYWVPLQGRQPLLPVDFLFDGNGHDVLGSEVNINMCYDLLGGYRNKKPFYQFSEQSHNEMLFGYIFEDGVPGWPSHLCSDYSGTYHFLWFHLKKFRDPATFTASSPLPTLPAGNAAHITWQNVKDALSYEIWLQKDGGAWEANITDINIAFSSFNTLPLSIGEYKIKVRAKRFQNTYRDSDDESSLGDSADPGKRIPISVS